MYTTLARLERDGLVTADDGAETQHIYSITDAGRDEVRSWFTTPVSADAPPRNELAIKLALAAGTPGVDVPKVIQVQRTATMLAMQNYTRARERAGDDLPWLLVTDSLIFAAEAQIRWLDHCEMRLARHAPATHPTPTPIPARSIREKAPQK